MHITITGNLGSGKSTICKILNEKYKFEIYSTGKVQRDLAEQMKMTTLELNQLMRSDRKYDTMIDDATTRISREKRDENIIFDSRLAWHFVEHSFKVFVSVSLEVAACRVMNDTRGAVETYHSQEEAKQLLTARAATEMDRYKDIYKLNYMDFSNYNLIIDSTYCTPEQIAEIIMAEAGEYEKNQDISMSKMLVSPKRLLKECDLSVEEQERLSYLIDAYQVVPYSIDKIIRVKKEEDNYTILEGMEEVKAALLAKVPYCPIEVIKMK